MKRPLYSRRDYAWLVVVAAITLAFCVVLYRGWRACEAQGGQYVRGLFWMECIK